MGVEPLTPRPRPRTVSGFSIRGDVSPSVRPANRRVTLAPMFDIGLQEMLVIGVLALLVFGPSKLPELGRMVGRALREFRRASDEFRNTVETNLHLNDLDPIIAPAPAAVEVASTPVLPSEADGASA